jgi:sigma-54 specific flagellar transcriptional regulator A
MPISAMAYPTENNDKARGSDPGLVFAPSSPLAQVRATCVRIAASNATVLLTGETGTGKEVFARLIHTHSPRASRPFVPVNCSAIPETLIESELFGYVRGAFTGANSARRGRVAMAEEGTLFLDEIGELSLPMQVKLLRLLQERTYEPVGSSSSVTADFRLVAATNRDLNELVRQGRFRSDLFYRLHVCPVHLPPLRERPDDIAALFSFFWRRHGETRPVSPAVIENLKAYAWPGNVRELENLVERVSVCCQMPTIEVADLPPTFTNADDGVVLDVSEDLTPEPFQTAQEIWPDTQEITDVRLPPRPAPSAPRRSMTPTPVPVSAACPAPRRSLTPEPVPTPTPTPIPTSADLTPTPIAEYGSLLAPNPDLELPVDLPLLLKTLEDTYIRKALTATGGNKKEAAKLLGLGRTTLVEKLRRRGAELPNER